MATGLFGEGDQWPKGADQSFRVELKPVEHHPAVGDDSDEPWGSAGTILGHNPWDRVAGLGSSMTERDVEAIASLVFVDPLKRIDVEILEHCLNRREAHVGPGEPFHKTGKCRKAMRVTARTGMLKEEEDPVAAPHIVKR